MKKEIGFLIIVLLLVVTTGSDCYAQSCSDIMPCEVSTPASDYILKLINNGLGNCIELHKSTTNQYAQPLLLISPNSSRGDGIQIVAPSSGYSDYPLFIENHGSNICLYVNNYSSSDGIYIFDNYGGTSDARSLIRAVHLVHGYGLFIDGNSNVSHLYVKSDGTGASSYAGYFRKQDGTAAVLYSESTSG
jgi:hypothetical protein